MTEKITLEAFGPKDPSSDKKKFPVGELVPITDKEIKANQERTRRNRKRTDAIIKTQGSAALELVNGNNPAWS